MEQVYPNGAVILNSGRHTWGINSDVFQRNFKVVTINGERELNNLDKEFRD